MECSSIKISPPSPSDKTVYVGDREGSKGGYGWTTLRFIIMDTSKLTKLEEFGTDIQEKNLTF